jgi:hypothetical protein
VGNPLQFWLKEEEKQIKKIGKLSLVSQFSILSPVKQNSSLPVQFSLLNVMALATSQV